MTFYGRTFIFNNIPSEFHNLYIGELDNSGKTSSAGSNDVSLQTQKLFRKPVPLFYGVEQTPVLSFPLSVYCPDELSAPDYSEVSKWLWGQQEYKKLRICQYDMSDIYYNCFLTSPEITRVGNIIKAFTTTVLCDSPFGWREDKTTSYSYSALEYSISDTVAFINESANAAYTYPTTLTITANYFGGEVKIVNQTDSNRTFQYGIADLEGVDDIETDVFTTGKLLPNEVLTFNCDLQIVTSSNSGNSYPLSNFNKNWLRFLPGWNTLVISGNILSVAITCPVAVKVGG